LFGLRRYQSGTVAGTKAPATEESLSVAAANVRERVSQQQQLISYWNQRVEFNKARWSPQMRETFDRNLKVIDQAVNDSFRIFEPESTRRSLRRNAECRAKRKAFAVERVCGALSKKKPAG